MTSSHLMFNDDSLLTLLFYQTSELLLGSYFTRQCEMRPTVEGIVLMYLITLLTLFFIKPLSIACISTFPSGCQLVLAILMHCF